LVHLDLLSGYEGECVGSLYGGRCIAVTTATVSETLPRNSVTDARLRGQRKGGWQIFGAHAFEGAQTGVFRCRAPATLVKPSGQHVWRMTFGIRQSGGLHGCRFAAAGMMTVLRRVELLPFRVPLACLQPVPWGARKTLASRVEIDRIGAFERLSKD